MQNDRNRRDGNGQAHAGVRTSPAWRPVAFAILMLVASTYRIPLLDQLDEVKITLFSVELLCGGLVALAVRRHSLALALAIGALCLVVIRLLVGAVISDIRFQQALSQSLLEARFGISIALIPVWYWWLLTARDVTLWRYVAAYVTSLVVMDIAILTWLYESGLVVLGERTESRFMNSIVSAAITLTVLALRQRSHRPDALRMIFLTAILLAAHTILITTSRVEAALALGCAGFVLCLRHPWLRWPAMFAVVLVAGTALGTNLLDSGDEGVAGRDYGTAWLLAMHGLPFGYGLTTDATIKLQLPISDAVFFSDYGLLLYILRYGVFGLIPAVAVLFCWLYAMLGIRNVKGAWLLVLPLLLYVAVVPLLDYGALNGAVVIAFLLLIGRYRHLNGSRLTT